MTLRGDAHAILTPALQQGSCAAIRRLNGGLEAEPRRAPGSSRELAQGSVRLSYVKQGAQMAAWMVFVAGSGDAGGSLSKR